MEIFNILLVQPLINLLVVLYQALTYVHIPGALGFAIILLTVIIRFLSYPLTVTQLESAKKMQDLAPQLKKLKEKHKGDAQKQQQETMRLYKEQGINPAAGCIPVLIQIIVLMFGLYPVFQTVLSLKHEAIVHEINKNIYPFLNTFKLTSPWDVNFFGIPLGQSPSQLMGTIGPLIFIVPLLTALFQLVQSKMMFSTPKEDGVTQIVKKGEKKEDDFATTFQKQSLYMFPIIIGISGFTFPVGLAIYWNTYTVFGILQQYKVQGLGGLEEWVEKIRPAKAPIIKHKK